jgi:hypothetical protein
MIWKTSPPTAVPSERYIPIGSVFIRRFDNDEAIALVLPQRLTGETQRIAELIERAPHVLRAINHLDKMTNTPTGDGDSHAISIANAWREVRRAIAGQETAP